jgi:hypothetical protein
MNTANVLMHLAAPLDDRDLGDVRDALRGIAGVGRVEPGRKLRRVLLVDYDPRVVSAQALLAAMRHRGFPAQLVGM